MKGTSIKKILFISLSNIGDAILTLPVLTALKDKYPDAIIDVVAGPRPIDIFAKDPGVRNIFIYDKHAGLKKKLEFISRLRKERYELAIDMRTSLIPVLIGARFRTPLIRSSKDTVRHKKQEHLDKLKNLSIKYTDKKNIYIDDRDRRRIDKLLTENGLRSGDILIGVSPACRSRLKNWTQEGFAEVITALLKKTTIRLFS